MKDGMKKLQDIQIELKLAKDKKNDFGKFNYRNVECMMTEIKDMLKRHNAYLHQDNELVSMGDKHFIKTTMTFVDYDSDFTESSSAFAAVDFEKKGMDFSQSCGAATTYCAKYALNALFLCDDGSEDADSKAPKGSEENAPKQLTKGQMKDIIKEYCNNNVKAKEYYCHKLNISDMQYLKLDKAEEVYNELKRNNKI